ncbi:MAG: tetratricopeptide repeat protein [Proteobacteria bacterium]|nr:tetratricopeptide repeat protein [Pseudomonadota bacterium]
MKYNFLNFTLNTDTKELSANAQVIEITSGHYEVLLFLLKNPDKMFTRTELIAAVWQGKYVTENSIDQIISKLRKILNSINKDIYIKTVYGKGLMFAQEVTVVEDVPKVTSSTVFTSKKLSILLTLIAVTVVFILAKNNLHSTTEDQPSNSLLLIMSAANANDITDKQWLNQASGDFIDQLFGIADIAQLKNIKHKPDYLDRQQYINNQWKIYPDLRIITSHLEFKDNLYKVELSIVDRLQHSISQSFSNQSLSVVMTRASQWLVEQLDQSQNFPQLAALIPDNSYAVELYMHGINSLTKGEIEKASHYLQLCLSKIPTFHLARLQMAKVKRIQGKPQQSLAILDTLSNSPVFTQMEVEIESIRGDIYDTQGKYAEARDLYVAVLEKHQNQDRMQLDEMRYNLSQTYAALAEYELALEELNNLQKSINPTQNLELLAHVLQKKASILQHLGHTQAAQDAALKSLGIFNQLEDLLGEAKVYIALARITNHQGNYTKSIDYLEQALIINRSLEYKLGVGATLNELIYVLMVKGDFNKAWQLNLEMKKIALEIDYTAMLQISVQYSVDISRAQKKYPTATIYLQEHLQLVQAANNKRALLKNKLLAIDLYLDQEQLDDILRLIQDVQGYIDTTQEIRLQPRINLDLARYYFLNQDIDKAIGLLLSTKELAQSTQDGETIIEINNLLAQHYIDLQQAQKALNILEDSIKFKPLPYPYLLLKSKANNILGNGLKALDLANECKNTANQWWSTADDIYMQQLQQSVRL